MAQSLDHDFQSQHRSESPAGSILRRLFAFWQHDDDPAPEVAPGFERAPTEGGKAGSKAFTIWTTKPSPPPSVISRSSSGRLSITEFNGFTIWANPPARPQPRSSASVPPPSHAFTLWSLPEVRARLAGRWERTGPLALARSRAFSIWTTPAALHSQGGRWPASCPSIGLPSSQAFSTWTTPEGMALLTARWDRPELPEPLRIKDPQPFSVWTGTAALQSMAARWQPAAAPESIRQLLDPHPFSIWTEPVRPAALPPRRLIHLEDPQAHSIWTTVEGLATAATRWIPHDVTAKVAPIPASFSDTRDQPVAKSVESGIAPFPSADPSAPKLQETETTFENQNIMEDKSTNKIQLTESKAFTIWSTPDHWKTNTIAASSANAPGKEPAAPAKAAALVDSPPEALAAQHPEEPQAAGAAQGAGDTWKWAFILTLIGALGIIASQSAAIRSVNDNIEREIASREEVSKKLAFETSSNADLTDQLAAKMALGETLANERADLQAEAEKLSGTIDELKKQMATKGDQISGMESAIATAKSENEVAAKMIRTLTEQMEDKSKSLAAMAADLSAAKAEASKLGAEVKTQTEAAAKFGAQAKEFEARLNGSTSDQQAMAQELSASADALSASLQRAAVLEEQMAELKAKLAELERTPAPASE